MNILFVDDNDLNREVLADMVNILFTKCEIDLCESALEVLSLDVEKYDLILSDIDMPKIDGFELYTKLRKEKDYKKPIVAITALAVSGDREKILLYGFDDYISKPIDMSELERIIKKYV